MKQAAQLLTLIDHGVGFNPAVVLLVAVKKKKDVSRVCGIIKTCAVL